MLEATKRGEIKRERGKEKLTQAVVRDEKKKKKKNRNGRRMEKEVIVELGWVGLGWLLELID